MSEACHYFKKDLNFIINTTLSQRKMVDLGKIFGRIIVVGYVLELQAKGFRKDLVDSCIVTVRQEVSALFASFRFDHSITVVEEYTDNSSWLKFV